MKICGWHKTVDECVPVYGLCEDSSASDACICVETLFRGREDCT